MSSAAHKILPKITFASEGDGVSRPTISKSTLRQLAKHQLVRRIRFASIYRGNRRPLLRDFPPKSKCATPVALLVNAFE